MATLDILGLGSGPPVDFSSPSALSTTSPSPSPSANVAPPSPSPTTTLSPPSPNTAPTSTSKETRSRRTTPSSPSIPPSFSRSSWIDTQLNLRRGEYMEQSKFTVYTATWNVNGKKPKHESTLVPMLHHKIKDREADIYVIAFQEIVDLNAASLIVDHEASRPWEDFIEESLRQMNRRVEHTYIQIATVHMVGLSMCVYIKDTLQPYVSDVRTTTIGVGIMGVGGNKGAVGIRFKLYSSSICFVNSHLAAHQKNVKGRNSDYYNICRRLIFPKTEEEVEQALTALNQMSSISSTSSTSSSNSSSALTVTNTSRSVNTSRSTTTSKSTARTHTSSQYDLHADEFSDDEDDDSQAGSSELRGRRIRRGSSDDDLKSSSQSNLQSSSSSSSSSAYNMSNLKSFVNNSLVSIREKVKNVVETVQQNYETNQKEAMAREGGLTMFDHDFLFWIGDLNYRINAESLDELYTLIEQKDWDTLLEMDQLIIEKAAGNTFENFIEGPIAFPPSYKYIAGTNMYDRRPDKKLRLPAWCDRIQWYDNHDIHQIWYDRCELTCSDHKPVMSLFEINVLAEVTSKKQAIKAMLTKLKDQECMPKLSVSPSTVALGNIEYDIPVSKKIQIKNIGTSVFSFECFFNNTSTSIPSWLSISPPSGTLAIDQTMNLNIKIHVDRTSAMLFISEQVTLPFTIIVDVQYGRTETITVSGDYVKSILGASLAYLNRVPGAIRNVTREQLESAPASAEICLPLFRLMDAMVNDGMFTIKGVITSSPPTTQARREHPLVQQIITALDTGISFDTITFTSPIARCSCLLQSLLLFLDCLSQPLLFSKSTERFQQGQDVTAWCYQTLIELPLPNYKAFIYITAFCKELLKNSATNGVTAEDLALCFSGSFTQSNPRQPFNAYMAYTPAYITRHFLTCKDFA